MGFAGILTQATENLNHSFLWVQNTATRIQGSIVSAGRWTLRQPSDTWNAIARKIKDLTTSTFWNQNIKYKLDAMKGVEWSILGASSVYTMIIMGLALKVFNQAYFPIATMTSLFSMMASCSFVNHRIKNHYNGKDAWDKVKNIKTNVNNTTQYVHHFDEITNEYFILKREPQFSHLEEDLKTLDQKIHEFKKDCNNFHLSSENFKDARRAFVNYLNALLYKLNYKETKPLVEKENAQTALEKQQEEAKKIALAQAEADAKNIAQAKAEADAKNSGKNNPIKSNELESKSSDSVDVTVEEQTNSLPDGFKVDIEGK
jgi:hypothetical protein